MRITRASSYILGFYIALVVAWFCAGLYATGSTHANLSTTYLGFKSSTQFGYIFAFSYSLIPFFWRPHGVKKKQQHGACSKAVWEILSSFFQQGFLPGQLVSLFGHIIIFFSMLKSLIHPGQTQVLSSVGHCGQLVSFY